MDSQSPSQSTQNVINPIPTFQLDTKRPHSNYCEYVLRFFEIAVAFIRFALQHSSILPRLCLDRLQILPGKFLNSQTLKGSEADVVYKIPLKTQEGEEEQEIFIYTLIEHKSTNDYNAIRQLARYYTHLLFLDDSQEKENSVSESEDENTKPSQKRTKKLPLVIPILFHSGAKPYTGPTSLKEFFPQVEGFEQFIINFKPIIIDLSKYDLKDLPNNPNEKVFNAVITIIKLVFQEERFEDVEKCFLELFPEAQKNPQYLDLVRATIQYFWVAAHFNHERFLNLVQNHYPQEIEIGENKVLSLLEKSHWEGVQEGKEEGREEGREEGQILRARRDILKILKLRFHTVPNFVKNRIEAIADEVVLNSIFNEAIACSSMEEFEKIL